MVLLDISFSLSGSHTIARKKIIASEKFFLTKAGCVVMLGIEREKRDD